MEFGVKFICINCNSGTFQQTNKGGENVGLKILILSITFYRNKDVLYMIKILSCRKSFTIFVNMKSKETKCGFYEYK